LVKLEQGKTTSPALQDNLVNLQGAVPKQSALFDVVCSDFPKDGHASKVMHPDDLNVTPYKQSSEIKQAPLTKKDGELVSGQLGQWRAVVQNLVLELQNNAETTSGFTTDPEGPIPLTGEMGVEAWVKMSEPRATNPRESDNLIIVEEIDRFSGYSLKVTQENSKSATGAAQSKLKKIEAQSADVTGIASPNSDFEQKASWQHIAAMHDSGFYADLTPKPQQGLSLEQLYLDGGSDVILSPLSDFTVEAMCFIKKNDTKADQVIASQWGETPQQQSWRLYITADNELAFDVIRDDGEPLPLRSDEAIFSKSKDLKTWKHIAAVYNTQTSNKTGLNMDRSFMVKAADYTESTFTTEFWLQPSEDNKDQDICQLRDDDGPTNQIGILFKNDGKKLWLTSKYHDNIKGQDITPPDTNLKGLNHFAITFGKNKINIYVNGMPALPKPIDTSKWKTGFMSQASYTWRFGDVSDSQALFKGFMSDIRICTEARTREDIVVLIYEIKQRLSPLTLLI
jgi:hypothetical protein